MNDERLIFSYVARLHFVDLCSYHTDHELANQNTLTTAS